MTFAQTAFVVYRHSFWKSIIWVSQFLFYCKRVLSRWVPGLRLGLPWRPGPRDSCHRHVFGSWILQPVPKASSDWLVLPLGRNNDLETSHFIGPSETMWHVLIGQADVDLQFWKLMVSDTVPTVVNNYPNLVWNWCNVSGIVCKKAASKRPQILSNEVVPYLTFTLRTILSHTTTDGREADQC